MTDPTWQTADGSVKLFLGDCLDVLPTLEGVDCTVTSPPYNQRLDSFKASGFKAGDNTTWAERASSSYFDSMNESEYQDQQREVLTLLFQCTSPGGSLFYNHKCRWRDKVLLHPLEIVLPTEWSIRQEIIWARNGSLTQNAKMFPPSEERIFWMFKGHWRWNAESNRFMSVWRINSENHTAHPVAYPIEIPLRCIEATTSPGDVVLDCFMGSATTGAAAVRTGRKFVGVEREPKYFDIAVRRIEDELNRTPLFDEPAVVQKELL